MDKTRAALDAFKPDFVLIWGDDQYENFKEDVVPPYCIAPTTASSSPRRRATCGARPTRPSTLPGHRAAAKMLATRLIEEGFDTAYAYKPLHHPLGHAFTNAIMYLDYDRKGFDYPIVPFAINCYGRRVLAQRGGLPVFDRVIDRCRSRSAGADAQAAVRHGRGDGAHRWRSRPTAWRCSPRRAGATLS